MNEWSGPTYYGRPQVKPAPFNKYLVGAYVFLSGLSGGAQVLGTALDLTRGRAAHKAVEAARALAMAAPVIGSLFLIADLHTPQRFYNMFRIVKRTSPMSIGSWILSGFTGLSGLTLLAGKSRGLRQVAAVAQVPAAVAGAGLSTYTAPLFASTSSPAWAAAPRALSVRFAASSIASAAAALSLFARRRDIREDLQTVCLGALAVELAATTVEEVEHRRVGIDRAKANPAGVADLVGGVALGMLVPIGLLGAQILLAQRSRTMERAASGAVLLGSLAMRVTTIALGQESARRPDISLPFARR